MHFVCLGVVKYIMQLQFADGNGDKPFYLSAIIIAGLLRDLTLGVSHDNYRKEIYIHVLHVQLQLFFKGSEVSRSEFSRSEVSRSEFSRSEV